MSQSAINAVARARGYRHSTHVSSLTELTTSQLASCCVVVRDLRAWPLEVRRCLPPTLAELLQAALAVVVRAQNPRGHKVRHVGRVVHRDELAVAAIPDALAAEVQQDAPRQLDLSRLGFTGDMRIPPKAAVLTRAFAGS